MVKRNDTESTPETTGSETAATTEQGATTDRGTSSPQTAEQQAAATTTDPTKPVNVAASRRDAQTGRQKPAFHYPVEQSFTGKVQYTKDGMASVMVDGIGETARGEVKAIADEKRANALVNGGWFAHVAADTPLGQPEEFRTKRPSERNEPSA